MADLTGMMQAAAGAAGGGSLIQEVFNTTLWTGNDLSRSFVNDIDLAGEGGSVWIKGRTQAVPSGYAIVDTARGVRRELNSSNTTAEVLTSVGTSVTAFNSNGFSIGDTFNTRINNTGYLYASWTFRKAPKFFDVVTYTGTGSARTVSHNLGSVPGCIMVKRRDTTGDWQVYHRANTANPETDYLVLNSTAATVDSNTRWNDTLPTDSVFTVGTEATVNASGGTYVAYLFAHDAGGFGANENGISCGGYTGNGSATGPTVTLGYEPQWLMIKRSDNTGDWIILDSKRDVSNPRDAYLEPNTTDAEATGNDVDFNATSFQLKTTSATVNASGGTYIYVAIRADM